MNESASNSIDRRQWYEAHINDAVECIGRDRRRSRQLSALRGVLFLAAAASAIAGWIAVGGMRTPWFVSGGLFFLGLLVVAWFHESIESDLERQHVWLRLWRSSLARLKRDWDSLAVPRVPATTAATGLAVDLDLFGRASLFQLVGSVQLPMAVELLARWMTTVPDSAEVRARQEAIAGLTARNEFLDELAFRADRLGTGDSGPDELLHWCEAPREFDRKRVLTWVARGLAALVALLLAGVVTGVVPLTVGGPVLLAVLAVNFIVTVIFAGAIHLQFNRVSPRNDEIHRYEALFRHVLNEPLQSPRLAQLRSQLQAESRAELAGDSPDVLSATGELGRIAWMSNLRRHGLLFIAWLVLQFGFLWDVHVIELLQQWKAKYGSSMRRWMTALAQWEVLAALARFARDHESWPQARIADHSAGTETLVATQLGHPLLPLERCVRNDVTIGPPGRFLLVTGSNMSGKSTLLRAVGTNTVLAQLGAPVCAQSLSLSPLRIETSMRIRDSLAEGVSFFMAELRRLKEIVDAARHSEQQPGETLLFLLDEILQGTNSRERHIAVTRVIRHLVHHGAIGAISTHDLELGTEPQLAESCEAIHFRESFETVDGQRRMTFDYRARPGIATTTNALELLRMAGLDDEDSSPSSNDAG